MGSEVCKNGDLFCYDLKDELVHFMRYDPQGNRDELNSEAFCGQFYATVEKFGEAKKIQKAHEEKLKMLTEKRQNILKESEKTLQKMKEGNKSIKEQLAKKSETKAAIANIQSEIAKQEKEKDTLVDLALKTYKYAAQLEKANVTQRKAELRTKLRDV